MDARAEIEPLVDYWHSQEVAAKKAYDYAIEQRRYWVNQLVTARQVTVTETEVDYGNSTEV